MDFVKCSINGKSYGKAVDKTSSTKVPHVNFNGEEIFKDLCGAGGTEQQEKIHDFFFNLAVCHTVIPEIVGEGASRTVRFSASSPDDEALVSAAKYFGFNFIGREPRLVEIVLPSGCVCKVTILEILEFTSTRKRMSVIVRDPRSGKLRILCKGADTVMVPRLSKDTTTDVLKLTEDHTEVRCVLSPISW